MAPVLTSTSGGAVPAARAEASSRWVRRSAAVSVGRFMVAWRELLERDNYGFYWGGGSMVLMLLVK